MWLRHLPRLRAAGAARRRVRVGAVLPRGTGDAGGGGRLGGAARAAAGPRGVTLDLRVDLGRGLVLPNPIGVASGTFGYGFEFEQLIDIQRLGVIYTKGTTPLPREGNPPPRVAETAGGMLNSIGLQNPGVSHVAQMYAPRFAPWRVPVIVNVAAATVEEYVHCVRVLDGAAGIAGYELNISCPNIAHGM